MGEPLREAVLEAVILIAKQNGINNPNVTAQVGSKNGENFSGEVFRISIIENKDDDAVNRNSPKPMQIIAKLPPTNLTRRQMYNSAGTFRCEKYVYEQIFPAFEHFQSQHLSSSTIFCHYPKIYASSIELLHEYILLNDLKLDGYTNWDRTTPLDFDKSALVLSNLAKFHAVSFAMKQYNAKELDRLTSELKEWLFIDPLPETISSFLQTNVGYALSTLNEDNDEDVIERIKAFREECGNLMMQCCAVSDYTVILHGDCWISNFMFKTNEQNEQEMKFLDWQMVRHGTVAIDISYFICCCTDSKLRKRLPELMQIYYNSLIQRINEFGCDGEKLFPFDAFQSHINQYFRFGFGMAVMILHALCVDSKDLADVQSIMDELSLSDMDSIALKLTSNPVYIQRMSELCRDLVEMKYL